jgi:hypothetical protein
VSAGTTLEALVALDLREIKAEVDRLRAIKEWAIGNLGIDYTSGDRVEIISEKPSQSENGWKPYREVLAVGRTGIAGEITFNGHFKRWDVLLGIDHGWSVSTDGWGQSERVTRYWWGPASATPEGFVGPSQFEQERHPDGKVKWFAMPVSWVRRARAAGEP